MRLAMRSVETGDLIGTAALNRGGHFVFSTKRIADFFECKRIMYPSLSDSELATEYAGFSNAYMVISESA